MSRRRKLFPVHGGHSRGGHGYESRDVNGFRDRFRGSSSRGMGRGRFSRPLTDTEEMIRIARISTIIVAIIILVIEIPNRR